MFHSLHAPVLCSLIIVRSRPELARGSAISSLALFTVRRQGRREARFEILRAAFDRDASRASIIDGLCERIPKEAELLVRVPKVAPYSWRHAFASGQVPAPTDVDLIRRNLPNTTLLPLNVSDDQLIAAGQSVGLEVPGSDPTPHRRRRRAPEQAMALWAIYTNGFCRKPEARALMAAFRAWHTIERVRPLPF
ncbi:hypothetical protein [Porphyrobacter sp. YT40]|uniref:hypothetical protein n=1 Tax=Porphyrobacter sp. YT40 TaxID=2547601 RepID=UPI001141BF93|nr:hypothetical protein [Porphyrobacter sp. YT40]QDH35109.1 hypothetical protein E2E27_12730 [Porphyrobacter sp. YT40]